MPTLRQNEQVTVYDLDLARQGIREALQLGVSAEELIQIARRQENSEIRGETLAEIDRLSHSS